MRRLSCAVILSVLLAAPASADSGLDPVTARFSLIIDSGRLGIMVEQSRDLLTKVPYPDLPPRSVTPKGDRAFIYQRLVSAVLDYNAVAYDACAAGTVAGALCSGPYLPDWLGKPRDYSEAELQAMADDAGAHLQPFWGALCDKAPKPADGGLVCPME